MGRRLSFGCVMMLCSVMASCSDSTAPEGTILIVASPDTVHVGQGIARPSVGFSERFVGGGNPKIWVAMPDLEAEVAPGKWGTFIDLSNFYLQPALSDWTPITNGDLGGERSLYVPITPGRYRVRQQFALTAQSATEGAGEIFVATSNPFVVVTP